MQPGIYPYSIGGKFEIRDFSQTLQALDSLDFVLHKEKIRQLFQVIDVFDVFNLIKAEVQNSELQKMIQTFDVGYEVIVKI